jgi:hypothetical protein
MIPEGESAEQRRYFMAANKTPVASDSAASFDSAARLRDLIGEDASATFESDPNFIDSNPGNDGSSDNLTLRDTDDTEDSEEEDEEFEEEDDDSGEDGEEEEDDDSDEEEDEDDEEEDEEDDDAEIGSGVLRMAEPINVHGPGKHSRNDIEEELEEMEEEGGVEDDAESDDAESVEETDDDDPKIDRGIDAALRMGTRAGTASEFAADRRV